MSDQSAPILNLAAVPPVAWRVRERLAGRVIDPGWLPLGLHPNIDAARERHLELLRHVAGVVDELQALRKRWKQEDAAHAEALREAVRSGRRGPDAARTSPEQRLAQEGRLAAKALAATEVLAEHVEHAIDVVRDAEEEILADLREQAREASEQRRQAEERRAAARRAEWKLARMARWTMQTADDPAGFGQQPAPTGDENPPHTFLGLRDRELERPWHRQAEELPPSWQELSQVAASAEEPSGDPTGLVQPLDDKDRGAAA